MGHVEAACDKLRGSPATAEKTQGTHFELMRGMALHVEDLDNRGRCNNIRLRGLHEGEKTPAQLQTHLKEIFLLILGQEPSALIEFVRAHCALRPKGPQIAPRDIMCCLTNFALKEEILRQARDRPSITYQTCSLQLFPDLSPATLGYRRTLKPLTRILQT
ncbi:Hypothetical predicted protein [Pelobates cultripes]|uniref:Uncharacterized protein n=1 Tax=Pelobates cultripes TaxID=61616 RepID=A0AAD1TIB4_PELCU|nr:Hypothetical predicted protein [Pelobates cultripes]